MTFCGTKGQCGLLYWTVFFYYVGVKFLQEKTLNAVTVQATIFLPFQFTFKSFDEPGGAVA